ncbi:hypothetical protein MFLAVUS_007401 [Mucor flavus]|uniref:Uncharacterized protein n=1 Tax=Mucor flavus TaxID=439312 RepID=A0ABP9Z4B3_9FUNG
MKCAEVNNADLTQLKRFVVGHVARGDLDEFEGSDKYVKKRQYDSLKVFTRRKMIVLLFEIR